MLDFSWSMRHTLVSDLPSLQAPTPCSSSQRHSSLPTPQSYVRGFRHTECSVQGLGSWVPPSHWWLWIGSVFLCASGQRLCSQCYSWTIAKNLSPQRYLACFLFIYKWRKIQRTHLNLPFEFWDITSCFYCRYCYSKSKLSPSKSNLGVESTRCLSYPKCLMSDSLRFPTN